MLAIGLTVLLFAFWTVLGYAVTSPLRSDSDPLQNLLLSPVIGFAITLLPVFTFNYWGIPVANFGLGLAIALLLASVAYYSYCRPKVPWKLYLPFLGMLFLALLLAGRPMLELGLNWLSYANDDMANYCLGAHRFLKHGYFDLDMTTLLQGRDYSQAYWFLHIPGGVRPGSELILAWVTSITGLSEHQVFMPVILAFHLFLVSATGALIYQARPFYQAALLVTFLVSLSALTTLGTMYQLIAQVVGLSLLVASTTLLLRPFERRRSLLLKFAVLYGLVISTLLITYPEVFPFLVLAFFLYSAIGLARRQLDWQPLFTSLGFTLLILVVSLNTYLPEIVKFLLAQSSVGGTNRNAQSDNLIFGHYLIPSGLPTLWGLKGLESQWDEPWISIAVFIGACMLLLAVLATLLLLRQGHPAAIVSFVMLGLGLVLFLRRSDFGLFKLAMFIQPFMLGTLVVSWLSASQSKPTYYRLLPLLLVGVLSLPAQTLYVERSRGSSVGTLSELPQSPSSTINTQFQSLLATIPAQKTLILDSRNMVLAKFQALYTIGRQTIFPSRNFFVSWLQSYQFQPGSTTGNSGPLLSYESRVRRATETASGGQMPWYVPAQFNLLDQQQPSARNQFVATKLPQDSSGQVFIETLVDQDIFNRTHSALNASEKNFQAKPLEAVRNYLMFIHSDLGPHYYGSSRERIAFYQLEKDFFFEADKMSGLGRHLLFQAINPSENVRLLMNFTASLKGDGQNWIPPVAVIGSERQVMPVMGRGAAQVVSETITPQAIAGNSYVGLDMGATGQLFSNPKKGLMLLYGTDIPLDTRKIVGFGRNISLISEAEYLAMKPPSSLKQFPADLKNPNLEYSGLYEDGWVSETAFLTLSQTLQTPKLVIRGNVPILDDPNFTNRLRVLVDGQEVKNQLLRPGDFLLQMDLPVASAKRRIDLRFSHVQQLQAPDSRPAAAQLLSIGFFENSDQALPSRLERFPDDLINANFELNGLDRDGWVGGRAFLKMAQPPQATHFTVRGNVPDLGNPDFQTQLQIFLDEQEIATQVLKPGDFVVRSPIPSGGRRNIRLRFSQTQKLRFPDRRSVGAYLTFIGFE